jgi:hypothetical protein
MSDTYPEELTPEDKAEAGHLIHLALEIAADYDNLVANTYAADDEVGHWLTKANNPRLLQAKRLRTKCEQEEREHWDQHGRTITLCGRWQDGDLSSPQFLRSMGFTPTPPKG